MTGIEKITERILADAKQEAASVLAQAQSEAEEIKARYAAEADQVSRDILAKGEIAAQERMSRVKGAGDMEMRRQTLAVKQEVLDEAFELALKKLVEMPERDYIELLAQLTVKASTTGREQLVFSHKDRARYGVKVATKANDMLAKSGKVGALTLAQESRDFQGGIVLADGDVEVNCTFETLVRLARGSISAQVAKVLFA